MSQVSPFEVVKLLHHPKPAWESLSEQQQDGFNVFIINRILSMNPENVELINYFQRFTLIPKAQLWGIYCKYLPSRYIFHKYISSKNKESINPDYILNKLSNHGKKSTARKSPARVR
jgi:hypothetical protein